MKKRIFSALLASAMVVTMLAGCGKKEEPKTEAPQTEEPVVEDVVDEPVVEEVVGEAIPDAVYYYSFDAADDSDAIKVAVQDTTATPIVQTTDDEKVYIPGVKGDAIYTNGVKGYKLTDVNGVGDTYSLSFWIYATRFANYMPTIQFGPDVHGDATGNQHYLNITRAEWGKDGAATFPCVWAYDQADNALWPNWAPDDANEHLKEWVNITLVVDANNVSADGTMLVANLYVNGEEYAKVDADGNIVPIHVVNGTMAQSDNFDFLVGINYWDAVFKGAFDELYIFDQALTAGQAKTLYEMGDTSVKYEEPERVVEVKTNDAAIYTLGTTDLTCGFWSDWTEATEIKDGETKEIKLKNFSDGINSWDNFVTVFTNEYSADEQDPNTTGTEGHREWAVTRADLFSWAVPDETTSEYNYSWGNWDTWRQQVMVDTDVTLQINRNGSDLTLNYDFVDYNGTSNIATAVLHTELTAADPCFFLFTNEASYVEIYSIGDAEAPIIVEADANAIDAIGDTTLTCGFWADWTDAYELADGTTKTVKLNNYSLAENNWENYVVAFVNGATVGHSAPADQVEGYKEYAVIRADVYGWGDESYGLNDIVTSWGDDWASWLKAMRDAEVTMTLTRNGGEIKMDVVTVDRDGVEYTNSETIVSTLAAGDPCYFFFTNEKSYVEVLSVE